MIKNTNNIFDIKYILDNLRKEDEQELFFQLGIDWKNKMLEYSRGKTFKVLYGMNTLKEKVPIAMGGFSELSPKEPNIACVWLLSTIFVSKNKKLFFKELKRELKEAEKKYNIMYNFIYKSNNEAKGWLKNLGFKFDNPKPKNLLVKEEFEFFYKLVERYK